MNDLVVDSKLTALVADDEHANAATAVVERVLQTVEETALVEDWEALLDITSLGHGNNAAVVTDVQDAVLLEDGANHVLDNDRWAWVADKGRLLVELLGEEVNTEVSVLASLGRGGDADDLAGTTLEDEQVTDADVVAWNGDGVWHTTALGAVGALSSVVSWCAHGDFAVLDNNVFFVLNTSLGVVVVVTAVVALKWVDDAVCGFVETVTEAVVVAFVVVIAHITLVADLRWCVDGAVVDCYSLFDADRLTLGVTVCCVFTWVGRLVLPLTRSSVLDKWGGAVAVLAFVDVDLSIVVDLGAWGVTSWVLAVVGAVLYVDLCVRVPLVWLSVGVAVDVDVYARIDVCLVLVAADACEAVVVAVVLSSVVTTRAVAVGF